MIERSYFKNYWQTYKDRKEINMIERANVKF